MTASDACSDPETYLFENTTGAGHWIEVLGDDDVLGVFFQTPG